MRAARRMGLLRSFQPMEYISSGTVEFSGDPAGDWLLTIKTSGSVEFTKLSVPVDIQLVGGGGGVPNNIINGAAGGKTTTVKGIKLKKGQKYTTTIGAGGTKTNGGTTKLIGGEISLEAEGGEAPTAERGGDGGSGGGAYDYVSSGSGDARGGSDGSDGHGKTRTPGKGQGRTTRDFEEEDGTLRAGAGAGCYGTDYNATISSSPGGPGGGGKSGSGGSANSQGGPNTDGTSGTTNYGGGGGADNSNGGSGIILIRNHRK